MKYLANKISKSIGIMSKIRKYLNKSTGITMHYSFVYPLLLYCNICWGNATQSNLWSVFKLQKIAIRIIMTAKGSSPTTPLFQKLGIIKLPDLYRYNMSIFMYKYQNKDLPPAFEKNFTHGTDIHDRLTRNVHELRPTLSKCEIGDKFL